MTYEEKTDKLLDYLRLVPKEPHKRQSYEIACLKGSITAHGLISNDALSVSNSHISAESESDWHTHKETEHLICYSGSVSIILKHNEQQKRVILCTGDGLKISPGVAHRHINRGAGAKILAITIPGNREWPKGLNFE